jgi:UDP-N-acetylglucosamine acyltransferase
VSLSVIHPTAVIDPGAVVGEGCEIGPYCVVGAGVELGAGCWLQHHVSLSGPSKFGSRNRFFAFSSIGQQTQDLKYEGEPTHLYVGDANCFREFVTVNRGTAPGASTRIGSACNFLAYSHIAHDCVVGDGVIFSNNGTLAGHVDVGDHAVIGGLTAVHQFCRIGRHAITGGCSKIVQDVPPFMIADGNPAEVRGYNKVGLQRHGFSEEAVRAIKDAYRIIYRSKLNLQQAIEEVTAEVASLPEIQHMLDFVSHSPRGIIK